jgi:cation:H+ antiporter|tara:strand:- start:926 stop:1879 length:954 start_codon:yes stop_codon:yes gene_type:complete
MESLLASVLWLAVSLILLIWGANKFIDSASFLASKIGISDFIIGLSVVALGTSFPEIFVGISAVVNNNEELALGTIIGSNISNIALIFGVSCIGYTSLINPSLKRNLVALGMSVIIAIYALNDLTIGKLDSMLLLGIFGYFLYIMASQSKNTQEEIIAEDNTGTFKVIAFLVIGLVSLLIGANYAVIHGEIISLYLGIPQLIVGLTVLAIGTSLPELAVTISALLKNKNQMILGNIIGSNILNIVIVMPILGLFSNQSFNELVLYRDVFVMTLLSIMFILIALSFSYKNIPANVYRSIGIFLVSGYIYYIGILSGLF